MPREYGQGFLNVLAYQDKQKANALAGERQGALDTERRDQQQFSNALATGKQELAQTKHAGEQKAAKNEQQIDLAQKIKAAPQEQQAALYEVANREFFQGSLPAYAQGGAQLVDQYAALGGQPEAEDQYQILAGQYVPKQPGDLTAQPIPGFVPKKKAPMVDMSGASFGPQASEIGTIPPGYQAIPLEGGGYRMEKIPGGPVEKSERVTSAKEKGRREQARKAGRTVIQDLQRGLNLVEKQETSSVNLGSGPAALVTQHVPWMDAGAAAAFKESALSNVGLDTLQNMRENSPTGGALGQVPIQQQKRLEQVLGSLDLTQRTPIVKDNLKRIINLYKDSIYGTPEEISALVESGELKAEKVGQYMFRHTLSFDEFGNPVESQGSGTNNAENFIKTYLSR